MIETSRKRLVLAVLAIWVAGFLAFSNSFTIAFQFDDTHTVQSNMYVRSLRYVPLYFMDARTYSYRPENSGYRPMSTLACALAFQLSRNETWGYHLVKLLEHCTIALLIVFISLRLLPKSGILAEKPHGRFWAAFFGGLIFAVHRANTETVDYITAISTLQAGLFQILAFYLYLLARDSGEWFRKRRWLFFGLSGLSYMAAMMSKEEGITLPGVIFAYELIYHRAKDQSYLDCIRKDLKKWAKLLIPYVVIAGVFVALRTTIQPEAAELSRGNVPRFTYFITQFRSWFHYISLFFWPVTLNSDNLSFEFSPGLEDLRVWACLCFHLSVWYMAWLIGKKRRFVLFGVAWFYITVLPASSFFPLVEAVNEHRMYTPFMMLSPLVAWAFLSGCVELGRRVFSSEESGGSVGIGLSFLIALLLGVGAHARNEVWQTDLSLWSDVLEKNPSSPRAMNVLGISLLNEGELERSVALLERCHEIAPTYLPCVVHLSIAYSHLKKYDEGLTLLKQGLRLDPNYPHLNYHLGLYYKDYFGNFEEANKYFQRVFQLTSGRFFQAGIKVADMALEEGRLDEAVNIASRILQIDQSNGDAWEVLGRAKLAKGDFKGALDIFERLLEVSPYSARYRLDRANLAERTKDYKAAEKYFASVTESSPIVIQAWIGLNRVRKNLGDNSGAALAEGRAAELLQNKRWNYFTSLLLVGEKSRQVRPAL